MDGAAYIFYMRKTLNILDAIISQVTPEEAVRKTDGPGGWNVISILCHLRDYDQIFYERVLMMLEQDNPQLPAYNHEALAVERDYNNQNLDAVFRDFVAKRRRFINLFSSLQPDQWQRPGIHPEYGPTNVLERARQVVFHDINHTEQIVRVLELPRHSD